jgi:phosphorylcholine metabolism protein LicD
MRLINILLAVTALVTGSDARPAMKVPSDNIARKRDADFASVRTRLTKDYSGKRGDPKNKYFHESTFHPHMDGRFGDRVLSYDDRRSNLTTLMQTYLSTMNDIGAETWIMHGSLLGWFWNRKIMPWDSDVDVQMTEKSMEHLSGFYNMTVHHYKLPAFPEGRDYMLEVNPHWRNSSTTDKLNVIDARWIDMSNGLFIDITTLHRNMTAEALGIEGAMMCKDKHSFNFTDIFPLRESVFENTPVKVPYAYTDLLAEEYGSKALVKTTFENHHFDQQKMEWIPLS